MKNRDWSLAALLVLVGCHKEPKPADTTTPALGAAAASAIPANKNTPQAGLDRLDTRTPVPLVPLMAHHQKQNMRDHLAAVQEIVAAVAQNDFPTIEKAAARIGFSETMGRMCSHMGAGAPGFTETALRFHHDADKIGEAARQRSSTLVLTALGQTLSHCTGCHQAYKQHVVDEAAWSATAGAPAPNHHGD